MKKRYLTKSRFQLALECPTKLYYYGKNKYPNTKDSDEFLKALAQGGFQVGALAKCYHPGGIDITTLDYEESLRQTNELLEQDKAIIFEAAVRYKNLFIRVDILEKIGNHLNLIEVKAKSINPREDDFTEKSSDFIQTNWLPYLCDVAYQTWIMEKAFPEYSINPFLMLTDKSQVATVDGLNQHFFLKNVDDRTKVEIKGDVNPMSLGNPVLVKMPVRQLVEKIRNGNDRPVGKKTEEQKKPFADRIWEYSGYYERDEKFPVSLGKKCKDCEYRATDEDLTKGLISGYRECWQEKLGWDDHQFNQPHVFDIWFGDSGKFISSGQYLMEDLRLEEEYMEPGSDGKLVLKKGRAKRQHLQISKALNPEDQEEVIDPRLFDEMGKWKFPLHFIDFETSMVAIPFTKDRRPYEQIVFQFSCHTINKDGTGKHDEWISAEPGYFPNFDFVNVLKEVLEKDNGSIFRYAPFENTVLRQIHDQLIDARDLGRGLLPDNHAELISFIDEITEWKDKDDKKICFHGPRNMIDLCQVVIDYYYHPAMGGSNSIKSVLPAIFRASDFIKEKYSTPYTSKNYQDMIWWQEGEGKRPKAKGKSVPMDPYKLLPPIYENIDLDLDELVLESDQIQEGGAAMVAYARMQFTEMTDKERQAIIQGLLKYCELDTLAMVMIWEYWSTLG